MASVSFLPLRGCNVAFVSKFEGSAAREIDFFIFLLLPSFVSFFIFFLACCKG